MKNSYLLFAFLGATLFLLGNCGDSKQRQQKSLVREKKADATLSGLLSENFNDTIDQIPIGLYILGNSSGLEAVFTNYGQRLVSLMVPDRQGKFEDIVLGYDSLAPYTRGRGGFFGATVGRYGNRIADASFHIDGASYRLAKNNGDNHIHGGEKGFDAVAWKVDSLAANYIRFHRISPDLEEGYPGNLEVWISYLLNDSNELIMEYTATTDKKTHVNLTNHSYFNLKGAGEGTVGSHRIQINADAYTPVDAELIPTGEIRPVTGTPFDFRKAKTIDRDIDDEDEQLRYGSGYDHNFVLNKSGSTKGPATFAIQVTEPESGRIMEVYTTEPGVQLYGGNFLGGQKGKNGKSYGARSAFCLETQHFPNSPNESSFPSTLLEPGRIYETTTVFAFDIAP
jgi:aldose 1-epimerase